MSAIDSKHPFSRTSILAHADALDCTIYRPDERDPDAEEEDLGDARILFAGPFEAPADWDAHEREAFFGDAQPEAFVNAFVECEAKPGSKAFFTVEIGDYVAVMETLDKVVMYFVQDRQEQEGTRRYVLVRDDEPLF